MAGASRSPCSSLTLLVLLSLSYRITGGTTGVSFRVSESTWQQSLQQVPAILQDVKPRFRERCERVLRGLSRPGFSQAWQDWWLYRNFFAGQRQGTYLDIGTNDPILISNTVFFDACLGWKGVCFEPQASLHKRIRQSRSCLLIPRCVLGRAANVTHSHSGGDFKVSRRIMKKQIGAQEISCVGVLDVLQSLKAKDAGLGGAAIDLLSIDIEGAEADVLQCMPWDVLNVRVILIETNKHQQEWVDMFFSNHGYMNVATLLNNGSRLDNVYVEIPGGKFVTPTPWPTPGAYCTAEDRVQNKWCHGYMGWPADRFGSMWKACTSA